MDTDKLEETFTRISKENEGHTFIAIIEVEDGKSMAFIHGNTMKAAAMIGGFLANNPAVMLNLAMVLPHIQEMAKENMAEELAKRFIQDAVHREQ